MFESIGKKIMSLAKIVAWIGIIASVVIGTVQISVDETFIFSGIIVILMGSLVSWLSSFLLYGFGKLIDNTDILVAASIGKNGIVQKKSISQQGQKKDQVSKVVEKDEDLFDEALLKLEDLREKGEITEEQYQDMVYQHYFK